MTGKFKILILLVALVALPLRGIAAVAMWHCAQDQHEKSASTDGHGDYHGQPVEQDGHGADHAHDAAAQDESSGTQASAAAPSCSACAACCVGGALVPSAWSSFSLEAPGASAIAFVPRSFTGVVPAQLERPPLVLSL